MNDLRCLIIRLLPLLMTVLMFLQISCESPTKTQKGIMSGRVNLFEEESHSGITVSVFSAEVVPGDVIEIKKKYPNLAFDINDKIWFDHRLMTALDTDITDSTGKFSFKKLPYGEYILAYYKDGWGYDYKYGLMLNHGAFNVSDNFDLTLYPEQEVPGYVNEVYEIKPNKCYVARDDVIFGEQSQVIFGNNSRLLLDKYVKVDMYGSISCPEGDDRAFISSCDGIYGIEQKEIERGEGINVYSSNNEWRNLSLSHLQNAFTSSGDNILMDSLSFLRCYFGLLIKHCDNVEIKNSLFADNNIFNAAACNTYAVSKHVFQNNIVYNNYIGMRNRITVNSEVKNNMFSHNQRGFLNNLESECVFENNHIAADDIGIVNSGKSDLDIINNHIEARVAIRTANGDRLFNTPEKGITRANFNNIIAEKYAVESLADYVYTGAPFPLDFKNNYWGTTDTNKIDDLIVDYQKIGLENIYGYMRTVIEYIPIRRSKIVEAGIQR